MRTTTVKIDGMSCSNCIQHVQKALERVPAVKTAHVVIGQATVEHENATNDELLEAIRAAGDYAPKID